jgi:hypothetical protein
MRTFTVFSILLSIVFGLSSCNPTSVPSSTSTGNLGETRASSAIRQFLSTLGKPYSNPQLLSTGPIIVDGNKRKVSFKWSSDTLVARPDGSTVKELDGAAVFEPTEDGKWYLTQIQYTDLLPNSSRSPNVEVK